MNLLCGHHSTFIFYHARSSSPFLYPMVLSNKLLSSHIHSIFISTKFGCKVIAESCVVDNHYPHGLSHLQRLTPLSHIIITKMAYIGVHNLYTTSTLLTPRYITSKLIPHRTWHTFLMPITQ